MNLIHNFADEDILRLAEQNGYYFLASEVVVAVRKACDEQIGMFGCVRAHQFRSILVKAQDDYSLAQKR